MNKSKTFDNINNTLNSEITLVIYITILKLFPSHIIMLKNTNLLFSQKIIESQVFIV